MRTTLSLKESDIQHIQTLAKKLEVHQSEVVKKILSRIVRLEPILDDSSRGVSYQDEDPSITCFHIEFTQCEYELNFDLKKTFKCSLSLLVSFGLALFAEELNELPFCKVEETKKVDRYPNSDYHYVSYCEDNVRIMYSTWKRQKE